MYRTLAKRKRRLRGAAGVAAATAMLLAAAACGSSGGDAGPAAAAPSTPSASVSPAWQQVIDAAKKEGSVTIYSGQGLDQLNDLAARFKKEYGISVQVVRAIDSELVPKVDAEQRTGHGIADIYVSADLGGVKDRSGTGDVVAPTGPAFDNPVYAKATRVPEGTYWEADAAVLTFGWNTDLYPKGIKDYPDFLDPALKGKIGVVKPTSQAMVDFYQYLEQNYGADFVQKLAAQNPRIYPGALPIGQATVSGEIAATIYAQPLIDEKKDGAPVDWGLAKQAWGARFWGQILKTAPHPNAAQLLANFIVTKDGQTAIARKAASVLPDTPGAITTTDHVRKQDLTKLTPDFVRSYETTWNSLFT